MTAEKKIAQKRLTLLQVAERLRTVSEACRRHSGSRSQFYEYKRAFQERGFEGLLDRPPIPKSFPNETSPETREKVISFSLRHPAWSCMRISDHFRLEGISVSASTIRNLWIKEKIETKYKRLLRLGQEKAGQELELTVERVLTDNGRGYSGRAMIHPYEIFLELNEIEHRKTQVRRPRTNEFVERFNRTALDEFFRETFRDKFYVSTEELQEDLDKWLEYYNYERPHRGYRNMGKHPIETTESGKLINEQILKQAA